MNCNSIMPSITKVKQKIAWTFGFGRKTDMDDTTNNGNSNSNEMNKEETNDENERSENKFDSIGKQRHAGVGSAHNNKKKTEDTSPPNTPHTPKKPNTHNNKIEIETQRYETRNMKNINLLRSPSLKSACTTTTVTYK